MLYYSTCEVKDTTMSQGLTYPACYADSAKESKRKLYDLLDTDFYDCCHGKVKTFRGEQYKPEIIFYKQVHE